MCLILSRTIRQMNLKSNRQYKRLEPYKTYITDDPGLTWTYFNARLTLFPETFEWEKYKTAYSFKTIDIYEMI